MNLIKLLESLSPNEKKVLPYIKEQSPEKISEKTGLDKVSVLRALEYLQNKEIIKMSSEKKQVIEIGVNGALYRKKGLPERQLLDILDKKHVIWLKDAQIESSLNDDEFKASLGVLKKKTLIELKNGKIVLKANKEEIAKTSLEEAFIKKLPRELNSLTPEEKFAFESLKKRREIIQLETRKEIRIEITEIGEKLLKEDIKTENLIEQITPKILKDEKMWRRKKFRRYDITSKVPKIYGGKRHFVNQSVDYGRKIWAEMGFKEMSGDMIQSSFWNFDALFQPQDHPAREMQDTFFIDKKTKLPNKKIVQLVKKAHEQGTKGSKGWGYKWDEEEAKKLVLRTHTTCLSAKTLSKLKKSELPAKFFGIGKNFRNETVDWSHGFEFNQTEGIVVDKNTNFRHLLGYLKQFFKKMGFEKIRFSPAYFPYTEPSVEIHVWHPDKKIWLELGGAGIFRPEVTIPLLGENIPVLAWGPGFDRILMDYYGIKDLRDFYKNNISQLRKMKFWVKD